MTQILGGSTVRLDQALAYAETKGANMRYAKGFFEGYWYIHALGHPVRPEVLAAQALLETSRFNYGRMVLPGWYNPCGMRTGVIIGPGEQPYDHERCWGFADGVAMHADHLALYAGAPGFPKIGRTRDPRHFPYLKGLIRSVEALGIWVTGNPDSYRASYGQFCLTAIAGMEAMR